jgi:hypothetical protein
MIDPRDLDRVRCVLESIEGMRGFALTISFDEKIEVLLNGAIVPEQSAQAILDIAEQIRTASAEQPLTVN